jgi:hypothetical protein
VTGKRQSGRGRRKELRFIDSSRSFQKSLPFRVDGQGYGLHLVEERRLVRRCGECHHAEHGDDGKAKVLKSLFHIAFLPLLLWLLFRA